MHKNKMPRNKFNQRGRRPIHRKLKDIDGQRCYVRFSETIYANMF